jgi:hypothetical protein
MNQTRCIRQVYKIVVVCLLSLMAISACVPPWGSAKQATDTRAKIQGLEQYNEQMLLEISNLLDRYTAHPGVKMLVDQMFLTGSPNFPIPPLTRDQLNPNFGEYKEISPGVFELVTTIGSYIGVTYLDGTNIGINLQFKGTFNDELSGYELFGPALLYYTNNISGSNMIKGLQSTELVEGIWISGKIKFQRKDGTTADLQMQYYLGGRLLDPCKPQLESPSVYQPLCDPPVPTGGEYIRGRHIHFDERLPNDDFKSSLVIEATLYRPSEQAGVWLGKHTLKRVTNYRTLFYDKGIRVSNLDALVTPGVTEYSGYGAASNIVGGFWPRLVALLTSGSYRCDLSNPSTAGTGEDIVLKWQDDYLDPVFPSPKLTCADLVWQQL